MKNYKTDRKLMTAKNVFDPAPMDYEKHNEEVDIVWKRYGTKNPYRMPMMLGVNCRHIMLDPKLNPEKISFMEYFNDPYVMLQINLRFEWYMRHFLPRDSQMGPAREWGCGANFMNTIEAEWFGGQLVYINKDLPDVHPFISDEGKWKFVKGKMPDPFGGAGEKCLDFYTFFKEMADKGFEYEGTPLKYTWPPLCGTDGPVTVACAIRGATEFCIDLYEDPEFADALLEYITDATIQRIKAWRKYAGIQAPAGYSFADDSVALLSKELYERFVLRHHKRLIDELSLGTGPNSIHLCGDASRFFTYLRDTLNIRSFDTGFPINHGQLARELGPDIQINGGPNVNLLLHGSSEAVYDETKRIISEVKPYTKRFVMREANNLAPCTPDKNIEAMYRAVKEYGMYI